MERTKEQKKAILLHGCNILVAAAAGSGKTSVLIERILTMVSGEHPVDIDRLLVVTFTNAAAAEMRERMEKALEEKFEKNPDNKNLQKQITLLHRSHIMTIDSFCAEVLRNHFEEVGLDPSFRIADNTELKLLEEDILADVLENCYQNPEEFPGFLQFVDSYAPGKSDQAVENIILSVYRAASAYPDPKGWLLEKRKEMENIESTALEEQEWMKKLLSFLKADLESYQKEIKRLLELCKETSGLMPYQITLETDLEVLTDLMSKNSYSEYANAFFSLSFEKLGRIKKADKEQIDPEKIKEIKEGRDAVKAAVSSMKEHYFPELLREKEKEEDIGEKLCRELLEDLSKIMVPMLAMYDIVLAFLESYTEAKRERNILDFSDQEHLALQILVNADGTLTKAALELKDFFEEILIDEYQDSNRLQEVILSAVSKGNNIVMVGDVKQSIYKFRLARPELFMEKYHTYSDCNLEDTFGKPEAKNHKIDLSKNFRSRKSVLDTVNYLFSRIMGKKLGNIEYDKAAALYYGASYPSNIQDQSEIMLILPEAEEEETTQERERGKIELEAAHIAERIKELILQGFEVCDKGKMRPIQYGDIAILLRTMSGWSEVFLKTLQEAGIPSVTATAKGYFEAAEIKVLLNLLKIIDNEQQDIPLAAVMLSTIGNFTEEELSIIRGLSKEKRKKLKENLEEDQEIVQKLEKKEDTLFLACQEFMEEVWTEEISIKLQMKLSLFFQQIKRFRNLAACLPVPELIEQILIITGYDNCVRAMPDGEKRYGNVRMLMKKAGDFEMTSYHGLFQFNRYMERLKKYDIDFGEADTAGTMNAVQIMSIHKSKGLEFPIVFVSGLGKQFNLMDTRKNIVVHQELFVGADFVDLKRKIQVPTVLKRVLQKDMVMETLAEELRVLYVAMTRAKEKLILTGCVEKAEEKKKKWRWQGGNGKISIHVLGSVKTFLDMIMPVFLQEIPANEDNKTGFDFCQIDIRERKHCDLKAQAMVTEKTREWKRQELLHYQKKAWEEKIEQPYYKEILSQMEQIYPYEKAVQLKTKFTVSELKRASMEEWDLPEDSGGAYLEERETLFSWNPERAIISVPDTDDLFSMKSEQKQQREKLVPSFVGVEQGSKKTSIAVPFGKSLSYGKQKISGTMVGTAYHEVMRRLNFAFVDTKEQIQKQLIEMEKKGILTKEESCNIKIEKIWKFLNYPIGKRILLAQKEGRLYREQPFVMGIDSAVFTKEKKTEKKSDIVLVQGVIDLFFEEEGKIILLDYKTDHIKNAEDLKKRYYKQLEYYKEALIRTKNLPVEERYLYSFHLEELIVCDL